MPAEATDTADSTGAENQEDSERNGDGNERPHVDARIGAHQQGSHSPNQRSRLPGGENGILTPYTGQMATTNPLATIWPMARTQTLVQLSDELLRRLDERAAREGRSRSALIRDAIEAYLADEAGDEISRRIIEGYERIPETEEEMAAAEREAREAVREEPW